MTHDHHSVVDQQFGPRAAAYVGSAVHASGPDLDAVEKLAEQQRPHAAIDLGTGGGHVAYRLAPHAGRVTAVDLSASMLAAVAASAQARGLVNIETVTAAAEDLPFPDGAFGFLACRFSAHHWRDLEAGLRQARRVLQPSASALFIDVIAPGLPAHDTHLQAIELLRDRSHVRNYTMAEWQAALCRAGFAVQSVQTRRLRMDYPNWVDRMQTPEPLRAAIRLLQQAAAAETIRHFAIEPDGSFTLDMVQIEAHAA